MRYEKQLKFAKELERKYLIQLSERWLKETKEVMMELRTWGDMKFGETKRKNGETVTDPRNIVDTGALYDSVTLSVRDNVARMKMLAYGEYVIMGDIEKGIPPRNFPLEGAERIRYRGAKLS